MTVKIRYLMERPEGLYYQRKVPKQLLRHYKQNRIRVSLGTRDLREAAKRIAQINAKYEADWRALLSKDHTPRVIMEKASALAEVLGVAPGVFSKIETFDDEVRADLAHDALEDYLSRKYPDYLEIRHESRSFEELQSELSRLLDPADYELTQQALGRSKRDFLFSEARDLYLAYHEKGDSPRFIKDTDYSCAVFLEVCGDLPLSAITRDHAHAYLQHLLKVRGNKTTSARRRLDKLNAVINKAIKEKGLSVNNPFARLGIPKEGKDATKREDYTQEELVAIIAGCKAKATPPLLIIAMLVNTGARLGEIAGLRTCDVRLDAPIPFISINQEERSLKTNEVSERDVPLLGVTLWAAQEAKRQAGKAKWLFPRYASDGVLKGDTASASCAKWTKKLTGTDKTSHHFRHTLQGRCRAAGVPEEIREAIMGWGEKKTSKDYGAPFPLKVLAKHLKKVAL